MARKKKQRMTAGSYCLVRQKRSPDKWVDGKPETIFHEAWRAKFNLPGGKSGMESTKWAVCDDCLAVPVDQSPTKVRPKCACMVPAHDFASRVLEAKVAAWNEGRMEKVDSWKLRRDRRPLSLAEVLDVWVANHAAKTREDTRRGVERWAYMVTLKTPEKVFPAELTEDMVLRWMRLYQEYGRRGWSVRGNAPTNAWEQLHALKVVPPLDRKEVGPWNQTIKSLMREVMAVFSKDSRRYYIREIAESVPELEWLWDIDLDLGLVDRRQTLTAAQWSRYDAALPALKSEDPAVWLMVELMRMTGWRSIEVRNIQKTWIELAEDDKVVVVLRTRQDFALKHEKDQTEREMVLTEEMLEVIRLLCPEGGSIYGEKEVRVYYRANAWLVAQGVVSADTADRLYALRKVAATGRTRTTGLESAREAAGHASAATTKGSYIAPGRVRIEPLTAEQALAAAPRVRRLWEG